MPSPFPGMDPYIERLAACTSTASDSYTAGKTARPTLNWICRQLLISFTIERVMIYALDYERDLSPSFSEAEKKWAGELLSEKQRRSIN